MMGVPSNGKLDLLHRRHSRCVHAANSVVCGCDCLTVHVIDFVTHATIQRCDADGIRSDAQDV